MKKHFKTSLIGTLSMIAALSIAACGVNDVPVAGATEGKVIEAETKEEAEPAKEIESETEKVEESKDEKDEKNTSNKDAEEYAEDIKNDLNSINESKSGEKLDENSDNPIVRAVLDGEKKTYAVKDVAGNWKYDKYDNMYLALYDTGKYEIYDIKSGDVTADGSYKVDGNELEITEKGKDPQKMTIVSSVRILDDEGDLLTPYIPESELNQDAAGDNTTRAYGRARNDLDYVYKDEEGKWQMKSASRRCYIKYPAEYYADATDDFLYIYDGDQGYVTVRNITDEFEDYYGDNEDFVNDYSYNSLLDDFEYFFGEINNVDNITTKMYPTEKHFSETYANLMNYDYDIQCASTIFYSPFKDGTEELVMINTFYRFADKEEKEALRSVSGGAYRKN